MEATVEEENYLFLWHGLNNEFWDRCQATYEVELSAEVKHLMSLMLHFNEEVRPHIQEIMAHPWMKDFKPMEEDDVREEM